MLAQRRAALTQRWIDAVINTYPTDAAAFMRRQKDAFANPAGHLVRACIPVLIDALESGVDRDKIKGPLEELLKLRALQDFAPSQAVAFIFTVKQMLREELDFAPADQAWNTLDTRVDALVLVAFDVYMQCRERVYEVRYNQLKKLNHVMLERANRMPGSKSRDASDPEPDDRGDEG